MNWETANRLPWHIVIVFGSGYIKIRDMVRTGFLLNIAGIIVTTLVAYFWGVLVFKIDVASFPEWATTINAG